MIPAGWCATCIPEAQALGRIHQELGDRVRILAVSIDPTDIVKLNQTIVRLALTRLASPR